MFWTYSACTHQLHIIFWQKAAPSTSYYTGKEYFHNSGTHKRLATAAATISKQFCTVQLLLIIATHNVAHVHLSPSPAIKSCRPRLSFQFFLVPLAGLHVEVLEDVVLALGANLCRWHLQWVVVQ